MKKFILFVFFSALFSPQVWALDLYGVYYGNCNRVVGSIIDVRDQSFDILTINGKIRTFARYQAIYLSTYPIDYMPVAKTSTNLKSQYYDIQSKYGKKIRPLLKGWAINFTEDQVSFLTTSRDEVLVEKVSLWKIKKVKKPVVFKSKKNATKKLTFMEPYPFTHCRKSNKPDSQKIIPQKLFADAVDIKREFDRLQLGHKELSKFIRRQKFYPRPEIYENISLLGMWLSTGSRYGGSDSRSNNFSPFLRNELSTGAYGYQHLITTGSGPIADGTHAEPQTHFYYRMKAEYVHVSLMADPNLLLVGGQYDWRAEDLDSVDYRLNETSFIEFGFDYGKFSLEFSPVTAMNIGIKYGNEFIQTSGLNLFRFGLRYTGLDFVANFLIGSGSDESSDYRNDVGFFRANFKHQVDNKQEYTLSLISKSADGSINTSSFDFSSLTFAGIYTRTYKSRFYFSGLLSLESYSLNSSGSGTDNSKNELAVTIGTNASLKF